MSVPLTLNYIVYTTYYAMLYSRVDAELPFMATEVILMQCVSAGGDRQVHLCYYYCHCYSFMTLL